MTARTIPSPTSAAYLAAALIHRAGPIPRADLLGRITFSDHPHNAGQSLSATIRAGWLAETPEGVTLSDISRKHFGTQRVKSAYVGLKAAPREPLTPLYARPPLSRKFIPSSKGTRDDVPEFSVRVGAHFHTQA